MIFDILVGLISPYHKVDLVISDVGNGDNTFIFWEFQAGFELVVMLYSTPNNVKSTPILAGFL
jgi:hypothetical protein